VRHTLQRNAEFWSTMIPLDSPVPVLTMGTTKGTFPPSTHSKGGCTSDSQGPGLGLRATHL
jgi:hypothetical protein